MSQTGTRVDGIIKALSGLESDIDSLNLKLNDMKKQLTSKTQKEIESLMEKTQEIATKEAESIITESKSNAEAESQKILQKGEETFTKIKKNIDTNFNSAVDDVVSSVLKP
jgi:V/A-type H+-transporting ATPase subunit G/H|tara:strand:+ start:1722 stop:2054 length:333 start_codon:yes stop_codon:yes gene_type:complete